MNATSRTDRKSGDAQVAGISRSPLLRLPIQLNFLGLEKNQELLLPAAPDCAWVRAIAKDQRGRLDEERLAADRNFKRPSGSRLPTTCLRVTGLMLRPSLGAAWLAWQIGPPVGFGAEPSAVAGPPSQRAAPPAWRPLRPSLELRTSGPLPARSPVNEIGTYPPVHSRLDCAGGPRAPSGGSL